MIQLIIFTRYPEAGTTKTRLIPAIGAEQAALLQKKMTEKLVAAATSVETDHPYSLSIYYTGGDLEKMVRWLGPCQYHQQQGKSLGDKMEAAFRQSFEEGAEGAIIMGADIPAIDASLISQSIGSLQKGKVVIGPSIDGGYYLIGLHSSDAGKLYPALFHDMKWSVDTVYETTENRMTGMGYDLLPLPILQDIDNENCLEEARRLKLL